MNPDKNKLVDEMSNISTSQLNVQDIDDKVQSISNDQTTRQECDVSAEASESAV